MRIVTVCLGNICRSPTAQAAIEEALAEEGLDARVEVDSAGTSRYHEGEPPDSRMRRAAQEAGLHLHGKGRKVTREDLEHADLVLAMDRANLRDLQRMAPEDAQERIRLFREFDPQAPADAEVPDPYFGGPQGFEEVVELARRAARGVVAHVRGELEAA
ncbi:low molecular weight phosphotyrosine protein phosphatase [Egibacter rhizosphaerae]|uniref:protein-tyrosine-phosphatase n=1 Tax=Egibacter rhizosphaerae TaxID=1670831 RepID=A0A411YG47_9ACTN|nr:low molecular weight protein-tyrosine-phosphatase [Egibacter rhizosphaerae]QBI20245.1 low molecular weight phosphotyrosine protein phosphatase [Egibacter rhizosphaerae]